MSLDQSVILKDGDASSKRLASHKLGIRLSLDDMPNPNRLGQLFKIGRLLIDVWTTKIDPAHDSMDERVFFCQPAKIGILLEILTRLDCHASVDPGRFQKWLEIRWTIVSMQCEPTGIQSYSARSSSKSADENQFS